MQSDVNVRLGIPIALVLFLVSPAEVVAERASKKQCREACAVELRRSLVPGSKSDRLRCERSCLEQRWSVAQADCYEAAKDSIAIEACDIWVGTFSRVQADSKLLARLPEAKAFLPDKGFGFGVHLNRTRIVVDGRKAVWVGCSADWNGDLTTRSAPTPIGMAISRLDRLQRHRIRIERPEFAPVATARWCAPLT